MSEGYDNAIQLVQNVARNEETFLNLTSSDLDRLPPQVGALTHLTGLDLSNNKLTTLPDWLNNLSGLISLNLESNQFAKLPRCLKSFNHLTKLYLGDNQLDDLPNWLGDITSLTLLDLAGNGLIALPERLGELTNLKTLSLNSNRLTTLPDSLGDLANLRILRLGEMRPGAEIRGLIKPWRNQLTTLPTTLGRLSKLRTLNLAGNQLSALPDCLRGLVGLTDLNLSANQLTELPVWLNDLTDLVNFSFDGNPLVSPPSEISDLGAGPALAFLRELGRGSSAQWSSKLLVVGEAAVGKTSVSKALCALAYDPTEPQTHGVHVDTLELRHPDQPGTTMTLNLWDFGGQLEYRATQRFYLTDRSLFLLVWNSRRGWRTGGQVEAWLDAIGNAAPEAPIVIVATHASTSVADLDEVDLCRRHPMIEAILRVDCQDGTGITELRDIIAAAATTLPLMGQRWPDTMTAAAERLAAEPGRYITIRRAVDILTSCGVHDEASQSMLLSALHDRGQILHFSRDPELRDIVVLQPAWVDGMITRVLDSQQVADRGGILSRAHRAELWHDLDDPGLHNALTVMMERFDLAYRIDSPEHEDIALVVERLPAGGPVELPEAWDNVLDVPGSAELRVTYRLPSRQAGIPSWFIAREHRFTTKTAWARGVLLHQHNAPHDAWALLQDDDKAEPTIRLTVRGTAPHVFFSILHEAFTGILAERYPGLEFRQFVPCICAGAPCSHEFEYTAALRALELGLELQCQNSFRMIDPRELLLGLRPFEHEVAMNRLEAKVDGVAAGTARIEQSQLLILDSVRDLMDRRAEQGTYCPSIFTVTKSGRFRPRYELRLYCEQPDAPHPLPDDAGVYTFPALPDWVRDYAPYLRGLLNALKLGVPLIGPVLAGLLGETLSEAANARLELSCDLLDKISPPSDRMHRLDPFDGSVRRANFAELRKALLSLDPDFGGLRERELPENRGVVYLCQYHREALHYPARTAPLQETRSNPPT